MTLSMTKLLDAASKGAETDDMLWAQLREASAAHHQGAFLHVPTSVIPEPGYVIEGEAGGRQIRLLDAQDELAAYLRSAKISPRISGPILGSLSHLDIIAGATNNGQADPSQRPNMQVLKPSANKGLLLDQQGLNVYLGQMIPGFNSEKGRGQAKTFTVNMAHALEILLMLSVDDPTQWGQFMPSAAFKVFPKPSEGLTGQPKHATATTADAEYDKGYQAGQLQAEQTHRTPWIGLGALGLALGGLGWIIGRRNALAEARATTLAEIEGSDGVVLVKTKPQSESPVGSKWSRILTDWMSDPARSAPGIPLNQVPQPISRAAVLHAESPNLSPNSTFGNNRFIILEKIGEGGMAVVYKAKDQITGDTVALKVLKRTETPLATERFGTEVKCIKNLQHDGIVKLVSHGKDKSTGLLYLAMDYVKGQPLTSFLKDMKSKGEIPVGLTVEIGIQLLQALREAHRNGIWHRDLKPSNIMIDISPEGDEVKLKVIDFGLAKISTDIGFTKSGELLGTPHYIAPEQINGKPSERSDLYAVGVILYEMFSGQLPFDGKEFTEVLAKVATHVYEPLQSSKEPHPAEADLIDLIHAALENKEGNRPQNATAFLARLKAIQLAYQTPLLIPEDERPTLRLQQKPAGEPNEVPAPTLVVEKRTLPYGTAMSGTAGKAKACGPITIMGVASIFSAASEAKLPVAAQHSAAVQIFHQQQTQVRFQSMSFLSRSSLLRPTHALFQPRGLFVPRSSTSFMR